MKKRILGIFGFASLLMAILMFQNCGGFEAPETPISPNNSVSISAFEVDTPIRRRTGVLRHSTSVTSLEMVSVDPLNDDDCIIRYIWRHRGTKSVSGWKHHLYINEDYSGPGYVGTYDKNGEVPETISGFHSAMNVVTCSMFGHDINSILGGQHFQIVLEDKIGGTSYFSSRPEPVRFEKYQPRTAPAPTSTQNIQEVILRLPRGVHFAQNNQSGVFMRRGEGSCNVSKPSSVQYADELGGVAQIGYDALREWWSNNGRPKCQ